MKHHRTRKAVSLLLSLLMAVQLLPLEAGAASAMEGKKAGDVLFNNGEKDRLFVSETAYSLAPGITEYVTYTNEPDGLNQNIDYFCEVDLSQAEVMTGYAGMENILEKKTINWRMQTVSGQVEDTQSYFTRSEKYADCTIAAALNADYYNMATGQPTGLLIIDGKVYNPSSGGYYFGIDKKSGKAVISNDKSEAALAKLSYAVGGGSLLVKDGEVNVGNGGRNVTYSAIGIKPDGTVVSMVCYGQSYPISCGYNQYEVAQMMKARGCQTAVLLDGITARIEEELGRPATLVVTGGLAKYVTPLCRHPLTYDPELLLKGLALLYQLNAPQQHHHPAGGRKPHGQNFRRHRPFRRERHETEAKAG